MRKYLGMVLVLLLVVVCCADKPQPAIVPPPSVDFNADICEGQAPLTVTFTASPAGDDITHWHWDFGDGQFSTDPEPSHIYTSAGEYTVSLAVMGPGGDDVETKLDYISVCPSIIRWEEAGNYIGQHKLVEGVIVGTHYAANVKGKPTFLNFHMPYKGYFTCIMWGSDRPKFIKEFSSNPETYLLNKRVMVSGLIEEYPAGSGIPEIILRDPSQIEVISE